jgi:hypothetical protein
MKTGDESEDDVSFQINEKASVLKRNEVVELRQLNRTRQHRSRKSFNLLQTRLVEAFIAVLNIGQRQQNIRTTNKYEVQPQLKDEMAYHISYRKPHVEDRSIDLGNATKIPKRKFAAETESLTILNAISIFSMIKAAMKSRPDIPILC